MAVIVIIALAWRWWVGPKVIVEAVTRRDFVQSVVASGHVETPHRVDIGAQITGTVLRVPVVEGQSVKAGDSLIQLESTELLAAQRQAELAVLQAQASLRQLREVKGPVAEQTLRQAQTSLDNAQITQRRNLALAAQGYISQAALDDSRKAVDLAAAQLRLTQSQFDTTQAKGSDYVLAEAAVAAAVANADAARARSHYARINAPVDGVLITRAVEVGDVVQPGTLLMTLSPRGMVQLVVEIDEKSMRLLAIGQAALASTDAYPKQRFNAQLVYINPGVNAQTGAVEVKLDVATPPATLLQDMTVSVDIEVERRPQALLIPASAIQEADSVAPWVLRVRGGRAVQSPVHLGLRSGGFAEVLDGLAEGDQIVVVAATTAAGARVRATVASTATSNVAP